MAMRCFFHEEIPAAGGAVTLAEAEAEHLFRTLRGRSGERILLIDGRGGRATAAVLTDRQLQVIERKELPRPGRRVQLLVAPPRHRKMDQLLSQCAEVGVWRISPVSTEREVAKPDPEAVPERWRRHLVEGCKQAHNPFLPAIDSCRPLAEVLAACAAGERWYGAPGADRGPEPPGRPGDIAWLVGPEGGFTATEEEAIRAAGFRPLSLGPWILRVETAAVVGAGLLGR